MRITANQVTCLRLLLLPVPVWMMYRGERPWLLAALALFVVLGLTDAVDGMLARRHGSTPLGALLDPVADKIFVVACFGPLTDFRVVPLALVAVLFVRELAVTALRSIALEERFSFRTSPLAKVKTTLQMGGAGVILLLWLFPEPHRIKPILAAGLALALLPGAVALVRGRRPGFNATWAAILLLALVATRSLLDPAASIQVVMWVIVTVTFVSGAEYAWGMRRVLAARFRRHPVEIVRLAALSLVVPATGLPALAHEDAPSLAVLSLLALELAVGGVDNSLAQAGVRRSPRADLVRSGLQALLGAALLVALRQGAHPGALAAIAWSAVAVTLVDLTLRLSRNRDAFRTPVPVPLPGTPVGARRTPSRPTPSTPSRRSRPGERPSGHGGA